MMKPIPYEVLVDLAEGRLSPSDAAYLRARIAADPATRAELAALERLASGPPPADAGERRPGGLRRLIGNLWVDSWRGQRQGVRSVRTWPRTLLLSAGDHELDLQIGPRADRWELQGQLLGPEGGGTVELSAGNERVSAPMSDQGEFMLPAVAAGRYTLTVRQGDLEIVVPDLELGPSTG